MRSLDAATVPGGTAPADCRNALRPGDIVSKCESLRHEVFTVASGTHPSHAMRPSPSLRARCVRMLQELTAMRTLTSLAFMLLVAACNRHDDTPLRTADGSLLSSSGGEVALSDGSHLQFVITSERYK